MGTEINPGILKQTDANSCLACSLLLVAGKITGKRFSSEDERQLYSDSFGLCRESFVLSYLFAFIHLFPDLAIRIIVDNVNFKEYLEKLARDKILIESKPITTEEIKKESKESPLIVLVDGYFFGQEIHFPHYVAVELQGKSDSFSVACPWSGEILSKNPIQLQEAIFGVKYILEWAPLIIKIDSVKPI